MTRREWLMRQWLLLVIVPIACCVAAGQVPAGPSWSVQRTPNPTGAVSSHLYAVSCPSASTCTAVGDSIDGGGAYGTLAERWNGSRWAIQRTLTPAGATFVELADVSCPSAGACMAVGQFIDSGGATVMVAERWDGTRWVIRSPRGPSGAKDSLLNGVSCVSVNACMAVGQVTGGVGPVVALAELWNGTRWRRLPTPKPVGATGDAFDAVRCRSARTCVAVGDFFNGGGALRTLAEAWNGNIWTIQRTVNPRGSTGSAFDGLSCPTADACTAVGYLINRGGNDQTLAERSSVGRWGIQDTHDPIGALLAILYRVSCTSATVCIAVGYAAFSGSRQMALAERRSGAAWSISRTPDPSTTLNVLKGVSCTSATACTAVGYFRNAAGNTFTLAERYS